MPPLRYGHSEGHTDVCYSDNSNFIITCGSEGDVRVWRSINDTDQKDICVGEQAWAVCQKGVNLYVATDTNIVQAYTFPELEVDGIMSRFRAPVTQIDVSPDGKKLAAGSCDMEIHVVDIETMESKTYSGHRAPVLSVSLDPHLVYLVSSSCDGTVRVWNIKTGDVIKLWDCIEKSNSFETAKSVSRIHFQPSGRHIAIPSNKSIKLYERDSWSLSQSLLVENNNDAFSVARFSTCNKFLAGGSLKGNIFVWDLSNEKRISHFESSIEGPITSIAWNKNSKSLVFCNTSGQLGELTIANQSEEPPAFVMDSEDLENIPLGEPEFEDDEDNENAISIEKIKAESGFGEENSSVGSVKSDKDEKESIPEVYSRHEPQVPITELQDPFQPSSTPSHLQQHYMVWNNVGIVRQFNREDIEDIDVEFHDTSLHHGFRMNNSIGYTMAALTNQALLLASPRKNNLPSRVLCILLKAWDSQKEWECTLGCEEAICVAGGENWVAVATDKLMLRIFSVDGTQTDVISIPGPFISMAGHRQQLTVFFYSAQGFEGEHFISYMDIKMNPVSKLLCQKSFQMIPLTPKSNLRWVGFSDEGNPSYLDSEGVLRLLYDKTWRPISALEDRSKGKFDHYFIIGICEKTHLIRCILCKGAFYPPVVPKPILSEIEWQLPLCEMETEKGKLEEEMLRATLTIPNLKYFDLSEESSDAIKNIEKGISVTVMKLFALACRSGLDGRAVSLCESMPSVDVVKLASKYAAKLGRHLLADKVSQVALKMTQRSEELNFEEIIEVAQPQQSVPSYQEDGSQDIFSDSESNCRTSKEKENLILKMKKKKAEAVVLKPKLVKRQSLNPFKKVSNEILNESFENKESGESELNYMDWFNENRSKLTEEYPLLKDNELAIIGMKKYRQSQQGKPEKINSNPPEIKPLKEKTTPKEKQTKLPSQESMVDVLEKTSAPGNDENKKRKLSNSEGEAPKKKTTSSSKLKAFTFSKKS